jgi:radical SAM superfamily enzyme YgiQ (UPF0313 family)
MMIDRPRPQKKILLCSPWVHNFFVRMGMGLSGYQYHIPNALLTLWAITPRDYEVVFQSRKPFWRQGVVAPGSLVGISSLTASAPEAYRWADYFRNRGAYVVMGGPHPTALPEEALEHCDSVVMGEVESVWDDVLRDFENGRLQRTYRGVPLPDFFDRAFPRYMELDPLTLRMAGLVIARGCKYRCDFCMNDGSPVRPIRIEQAIALLKRMNRFPLRIPYFSALSIATDNVFSVPAFAKELFRAMIPLRLRWAGQSSIDISFDEEALALARQSGCTGLFLGIETVEPKRFVKTSVSRLAGEPARIASEEDLIQAIRRIKAHRIPVVGSFIVGLDDHGPADYLRLGRFFWRTFLRSRFFFIALTILTPFPGTQLYRRLEAEGRLLTRDWKKYDLLWHMVFRPKKMAPGMVTVWFLALRIWALPLTVVGIMILSIALGKVGSFLQIAICLIHLHWQLSYKPPEKYRVN